MKLLTVLVLAGLAVSCGNAPKEEAPETASEVMEQPAEQPAEEQVDKLAVIKDVDTYREGIEASLTDEMRKRVTTENMRAQVRQKWATVDFYMNESGELVRVKTYPHEGISERTEEFYFKGGALVCAVIEDAGMAEGADAGTNGKLYYYMNGEPVAEVNTTGEAELSVRDSDAERLLQEANELAITAKNM
jgi:hypothetical protein